MNVELTALFKYAWAVLVPAFWKGWESINSRFEKAEAKVDRVSEKQTETTTEIRVLMSKMENLESDVKEVKELLTALIKKENN